MEIIYSGKEVKKLLNESIPGYKPVIGGNASSENEKINKKSNGDSIKNTQIAKPKEDLKPSTKTNQSTDLGNNKNMLDLEFSYDPGKEYKDRVKQQVTGEDSSFGNSPDGIADNKGNKAFYDAAKAASNGFIKNKQKASSTGLVSKNLDIPKKESPFKEESDVKTKKLFFKNTKFLSEKHMFSLIPEDYKKSGSKFIMKDKFSDEYLIEWKIDEKTSISEGIIVKHENENKIQEEFDRIKNLYEFKSKESFGNLTNKGRLEEDGHMSKNIKKLKDISDN